MPDDFKSLLDREPGFFGVDVSIQAGPHEDVSHLVEKLDAHGVEYSVRRIGTLGVYLVSHGLRYSGVDAVEQYLADQV